MKQAIGIDLGGTELRAALVNEEGVLLAYEKVKTDKIGGPETVMAQMERLVGDVGASTKYPGWGLRRRVR